MSDAQDKSDCSAEIIDDLVDRLETAEAQLEKVRNCQTYVVELDDCEQSWFKKADVLEALGVDDE